MVPPDTNCTAAQLLSMIATQINTITLIGSFCLRSDPCVFSLISDHVSHLSIAVLCRTSSPNK
jgi:hypothetical protein